MDEFIAEFIINNTREAFYGDKMQELRYFLLEIVAGCSAHDKRTHA